MAITTVPVPTYKGLKAVRGETTTDVGIATGNRTTGAHYRVLFGNHALTQEGADPNAVLFGLGNSTTRAKYGTANGKFVSFYTEGNADGIYGFYWRHYLSTAATGQDAARLFATVNDVAASNARALHASLNFGTSGTVTGLGAAAEFTLHIATGGSNAGTMYGVKSAINSDGAASDPAGATTLAYFAAVNQGDTTGGADVDDDAVLFHIDGHTIGDDNMVDAAGTAFDGSDFTHGIKIKVGSTIMWLVASTTNPKNT